MSTEPVSLSLTGGIFLPAVGPYRPLILETTAGNIETRFYSVSEAKTAVLWLGDALGGFDSPAHGLYDRLAERLQAQGVASMRLQYRNPNDFGQSGLDALAGAFFLDNQGYEHIVVVGHGSGAIGAVTAGASFNAVKGVALIAPVPDTQDHIAALAPTPLLVLHGTADRAVPSSASRELLDRAGEPKRIYYYQNAGHNMVEAAEAVERDLGAWLDELLQA